MPVFRTMRRQLPLAAAALTLFVAGFTNDAEADGAKPRLATIGGAVTEIVYALGREDQIVAVDSTSLFPPQALKDKANLGYFRSLSAEGLLSLRPDRILAVEGAGPVEALDAAVHGGVVVTRIPDAASPEGVAAKIRAVGAAVNAAPEAEALAARVAADFAALASERAKIAEPKRVLFVMAAQNGRLLCGGRGTAADALIGLAGGVNVADFDGYKPMTDEALVAAAPEAIVAMARDGAPVVEAIAALPAVGRTPAGASGALFAMDGLLLLGFTPRAPEAARALMKDLYPQLARQNLSAAPR